MRWTNRIARLISTLGGRKAPRTLRREVRPRLEALEERWCPTHMTYDWKGYVNDDASNLNNYDIHSAAGSGTEMRYGVVAYTAGMNPTFYGPNSYTANLITGSNLNNKPLTIKNGGTVQFIETAGADLHQHQRLPQHFERVPRAVRPRVAYGYRMT